MTLILLAMKEETCCHCSLVELLPGSESLLKNKENIKRPMLILSLICVAYSHFGVVAIGHRLEPEVCAF